MKPFSEELVRERARRGWTRAMQVRKFLAARDDLRIRSLTERPDNIARNFVNWERGVVPDPLSQVVLAVMHGRTLSGLFGEYAALSDISVLRPGSVAATGGKVELPHYAQAEENPVERRLFVAWLMRLSVGAVALPEAVRHAVAFADDDPDLLPAITMDDVAKLEECHSTFVRLNYSVGSVARKAVVGQLSYAVDQLRAGVPGTVQARDAWRVTTARLADTACWMSVDAGREQQARALAVLGCKVAASIEDRPKADAASGYFMAKLAELSIGTGRPRTALELVHEAQAIARDASPTTQHALHGIKAEAYGALGDARGVRRELGLAEEAMAEMSTEDVEREPWATPYTLAGRYEFHRGTAQSLLVRTNPDVQAPEVVADTCAAFDASARAHSGDGRSRRAASARLRAATTLLVDREPEEAVAQARQALPVLPALRSKRVRDDVHDLEQAAGPFRRRPEVADLLHDLTDAAT
jgi:hypothetical protein